MKNWVTILLVFGIYVLAISNAALASDYSIKSEDEAQQDFDKLCKDEWTKRGILDNRMYNYCYNQEQKGYQELVYTIKNNQYEWFDVSLSKIIKHWTKKGVSQWRMINYSVNQEIDAFLDVEYMKEHEGVSVQMINFCHNKYRHTDSEWGLTRYCLKNR